MTGAALSLSLLLGVVGLGGCDEAVPPLTDEELKLQWEDIPAQCMGFADVEEGIYRSFEAGDDPNPKEGEACSFNGGTADGGHCNVPCGFSSIDGPLGNKNCECASGFFANCACRPLPSVADQLPQFVGSCEQFEGAPTEYDDRQNTFADGMDLVPCDQEFAACITPDLPPLNENGECSFTTPKGCVCLAGVWQCESSNGWFTCLGDDCPQAFIDAGASNGNIKNSQHCQQ